MDDTQKQQVRQFMQLGQYDEARQILSSLRNSDKEARDWLNTLDDVVAQRQGSKTGKGKSAKQTAVWNTDRIIANVAISLILLLLRGPLAVVIYLIYDLITNRSGKITASGIVVGLLLTFGITSITPMIMLITGGS